MLKRSLLTSLAVLICVVALLAVAYQFRVAVIRSVAYAVLDSNTAVLGNLEGVELGTQGAAIAELELLLPASGLRVVIRNASISYSLGELLLARKVDTVSVAAIALTRQQPIAGQTEPVDSELLLSDVLQLLSNFPVARLEIADIRIPDRDETLAVALQSQQDNLEFSVVSGALSLLATVDRQQAATELQLQLINAAVNVADFGLNLTPTGSGYHISGTGRAEVADFAALLGAALLELLEVPLAALQMEMALEAEVADAFLAAPPALLDLQIQGGSMVRLSDALVEGLTGLTLRVEDTAQLALATGNAVASGSMPLAITGNWQQQAFTAALVLGTADCQLQGGATCTVDFDGSASLAALVVAAAGTPPSEATVINAPEFAGAGTLALHGDALLVTLNPDARIATGSVTSAAVQIAGIAVTTGAPLLIGSTLDAASAFTVEGGQINGTLTQLVASGYTVDSDFSLRDIRMTIADQLAGEAVLQTQGLRATGASWLPAVDIDAELQLQAGTLTFATPLLLRSAPADPAITLHGSYELDSGSAAATLSIPTLQFNGPGESLSAYLGGWPFPFDLMTGALALEVAVEWEAAELAAALAATTTEASPATGVLTGTFSATLEDAAGYYGEMFFAGLATQLAASIDTAAALPLSTPPLTLSIATFDVGVPVTDIALAFQVDGAAQTVKLASFNAALLGGSLSGEDVSYDFGSDRNFVNLRFTNLRLDHMLDLVEYDGIEVSGAVSGILPLAITPNGVEVEEGRLFAEAPGGSIRYLDGPTAGSGGNLGVDLVNQALGNYQFDSLESSIEYSPEGELLLGMQLQGFNPDMNNGQRINLNLNLSNNIPDLLDSLQAGRAIEEFLEGEYGPQPAP